MILEQTPQDRLHDTDPFVRMDAVDQMGLQGSNESLPALARALTDADCDVRVTAAIALGNIAKRQSDQSNLKSEAVPALTMALRDEDPEVRAASATALAAHGPVASESLRELKTAAAHDENSLVRVRSALALWEIAQDRDLVVPILSRSLTDDDAETRTTAAEALGRMQAEASAAIPALTGALQDESPSVREAAKDALGQILNLSHLSDSAP